MTTSAVRLAVDIGGTVHGLVLDLGDRSLSAKC
jgi:hypothetical protein